MQLSDLLAWLTARPLRNRSLRIDVENGKASIRIASDVRALSAGQVLVFRPDGSDALRVAEALSGALSWVERQERGSNAAP